MRITGKLTATKASRFTAAIKQNTTLRPPLSYTTAPSTGAMASPAVMPGSNKQAETHEESFAYKNICRTDTCIDLLFYDVKKHE
jgi:hypothetical protein